MNFLQLAKERYSVRKFNDKKVEKEKLDLILEVGRVTPSKQHNSRYDIKHTVFFNSL